jgi:cytochrome c oxidase subunit 2
MHVDRFERYWIIIVAAVLGAFFASLLAAMLVFGMRLPSTPAEFVNPLALGDTRFATPGLRDMGDGRYELTMTAQMWRFNTGSSEQDADGNDIIRVPRGSQVTFFITSVDVTHGLIVERHNLNIQVIPGHVGRATITFNDPGEFRLLCHEYCGAGHHRMHATIIVE